MKKLLPLICLCFLNMAQSSQAPRFLPMQCDVINDLGPDHGLNVKYCDMVPIKPHDHVMLYFHGLGDSEKGWLETSRLPGFETTLANQAIAQTSLGDKNPRVVSVSFGFSWVLSADRNRTKMPKYATVQYFKEKLLPELEKRLSIKGPYYGWGMSMGGANLMELAYDYPGLFSKLVFISPMWPDMNSPMAMGILAFNFSPSEMITRMPLVLAQKAVNFPPTYISASFNDDFKLYSGINTVANVLKTRGFKITFDAHRGGHSDFDGTHPATFLKGDLLSKVKNFFGIL